MIIHRVKRIIVRDRLDEPNRRRDLNYRRVILANRLRKEGLLYADIGALMGRHHSTIVYMIKQYPILKTYPDFVELEKNYLKQIEGKTLEERIISCEKLEDFLNLKIKVLNQIN